MKTYTIVQIGLVIMEAIACIAGIINWKKIKHTYWKWFVVYLGAIVLCEIIGLSLLYLFKNAGGSRDFYNYFVIPFEFLFLIWLYYQYFKDEKARYIPVAGAIIYLGSWVINLTIFPDLNFWAMPLPYLVGVIILLLLVILFFFRLVYSDEILGYKRNMMFWVSLGILIFYLVTSPFFGLRQMLYDKYRDIFWIYFYAQFAVNYMMYMFSTIGFLWSKPR